MKVVVAVLAVMGGGSDVGGVLSVMDDRGRKRDVCLSVSSPCRDLKCLWRRAANTRLTLCIPLEKKFI